MRKGQKGIGRVNIKFKAFAPEPIRPKRKTYVKPGVMCQHCGKTNANRPRTLCWTCYYTPGLKDQYPVESKYGNRGLCGDGSRKDRPIPPSPTLAVPQSEEKGRVLHERLKQGYGLWHPFDARYENDKRTLAYLVRQMGFSDPGLDTAIKESGARSPLPRGVQTQENNGRYGGSIRNARGDEEATD